MTRSPVFVSVTSPASCRSPHTIPWVAIVGETDSVMGLGTPDAPPYVIARKASSVLILLRIGRAGVRGNVAVARQPSIGVGNRGHIAVLSVTASVICLVRVAIGGAGIVP